MPTVNTALKRWTQAATHKNRLTLARLAKTSPNMLQQLVGGHRNASPRLARNIELGSRKMRLVHKQLPVVHRQDVCKACGACEFAKAHGRRTS